MRTSDMVGAYENSIPMLEDMVTTMGDTIESITGIDLKGNGSGGGATSGAFSGMSQDTGNEMNGRLTAIQIQGENVIGQLTTITTQQLSILTATYEQNNALGGIQQQIATSYIELQGIHEDTTAMSKMMKRVGEYMYDWDSHVKNL